MIRREILSPVSTRGVYKNDNQKGYVTAYDVNFPYWASIAETWWKIHAAVAAPLRTRVAKPVRSLVFVDFISAFAVMISPSLWPDVDLRCLIDCWARIGDWRLDRKSVV